MRRFFLDQLRNGRSRTATLGIGILVAAVSFTLLTSAATTSALQVRGTIATNWLTAYDILVRPPGSYDPLEKRQGLVRDNYLSGIFGGISLAQWHTILGIQGVEVAAPIENIGYILPFQKVVIPVNRYLTDAPYQLFRIRQVRIANGGLATYPDADLYIYFTRAHRMVVRNSYPEEVVPGRPDPVPVCDGFNSGPLEPSSPFDLREGAYLQCFSALTPEVSAKGNPSFTPKGVVGQVTAAYFPVLLSAIDPVQEDRLLNLDRALVSGKPLREGQAWTVASGGLGSTDINARFAPVLASTRTYVAETLEASVERLQVPAGVDLQDRLASSGARTFLRRLPGEVVGRQSWPMQRVYRDMLDKAQRERSLTSFESYRVASGIRYEILGSSRLAARPTSNPNSVWRSELYGTFLPAPTENQDLQYRRLTVRVGDTNTVGGVINLPGLRVVGQFDPSRLPGFSPLSKVPLETYYPPVVQPADAASRRALGGGPLLPTMNVGGYIAQPPLMLTTLEAARLFFNPQYFSGVSPKAPISVIRVRVSGVNGPDPVSRERVRRVALAIHDRTGLAVDITTGSSPTPILVQIPKGKFGQPALLVREGWVKKGVAVVILQALDRKSLALFFLVLAVTALFLVNGSFAAVRSRRREMGTLLCLGWSQKTIFRAVLGELALIGLTAGILGTGLAALLVSVLSLRMPIDRTLLVAPVATALAILAGVLPAWRAARSVPMDAVRPVVAERGLGRPVRRVGVMALVNLRRVPGRAILGAAGLFIGVAALSLLLSINLAFHGTLVGTALGNFISVQVRGVDYLGVGLAILLGAFSVADVLVLNLKERAPEFVTLRASGWRQSHLGRLVALEGLGVGIFGSVLGAAAGTSLAALVGASAGRIALAAVIAAVAGVAVTLVASLIPASLISRLAPPAVLAEE